MIFSVLLMFLLIIRFFIRPFYFSLINFIILFVYLIALATVLGRVKWSIFWIWGVGLFSVMSFFIFNEGTIYTLVLDICLILLGILGFIFEKDFKT